MYQRTPQSTRFRRHGKGVGFGVTDDHLVRNVPCVSREPVQSVSTTISAGLGGWPFPIEISGDTTRDTDRGEESQDGRRYAVKRGITDRSAGRWSRRSSRVAPVRSLRPRIEFLRRTLSCLVSRRSLSASQSMVRLLPLNYRDGPPAGEP